MNRRSFLASTASGMAMSAPRPDGTTPHAWTSTLSLDGLDWQLAVDPANSGRAHGWTAAVASEAVPAKVPWVIQDAFPDYHGVAWYWREFQAGANPHPGGRWLLRFGAVDYLAEVWVNGLLLGVHEGGEEPFTLDATAAIKPLAANLLAVRVLNPTHEPIDGIRMEETATGRRDYPVPRDNAYNTGGIVGSVELLAVPAVRIEDLFATPDWKTGEIRIWANIRNAGSQPLSASLTFSAAPATEGETVEAATQRRTFPPGDTLVEAVLRVSGHRLWELNAPFLYRITARLESAGIDERSIRCGFRDFRFENGYFRFNGRRLRLHGPLYIILHYPVSQWLPYDEDLLRRDVLNMKAFGFNIARISCGAALPRQLDLFDELGLLACEEHFGARQPADSPLLEQRWDHSIAGVIRRDRNHPSIVMWSLLNEVNDGRLFRHAANSLAMVRALDDSRMVLVSSGRFDNDYTVGSLSNPGSGKWEGNLRDVHDYPSFPHSAAAIRHMRDPGDGRPLLLSEYGVCGAQDYPRFLRHFEQIGKQHAADARIYRDLMDQFMADWVKWRLDECWARPEDYFRESQRNQAKLALDDYNAWMANPALVGDFTSTQTNDAWFHGCGLTTYFRELKPGMADAFSDMAGPVRWCLFVEPVNVFRGATVRLEAVLVNHDALRPGRYPVRLQVAGPHSARLLDQTIEVSIPEVSTGAEPPFARAVFAQDLRLDGSPGTYRFLATFQHGAAAGGGDVEFYVGEKSSAPAANAGVVLWNADAQLAGWCAANGLRATADRTAAGVILVAGELRDPAQFAARVEGGATAVLLTPARLPGVSFEIAKTPNWYFRADHWAKDHPIFDGLPAGGILDYRFYRDLLTATVYRGLDAPADAVAGAIQTSGGGDPYRSDLLLAVIARGHGRYILNSLQIRENLETNPAAAKLLRNLASYAAAMA